MPKRDQLRLDGQVAIVVCGDNGIGRASAILYAHRGAKVIINAGNFKENEIESKRQVVDMVVYQIISNGGIAAPSYEPITNQDKVVKAALDKFGRLDILACHQGVLDRAPRKDEDFDATSEFQLHAIHRLVTECWPHFVKQKYGKIIIASSSDGICGPSKRYAHHASKMSLVGLSQIYAQEGARDNICSNSYVFGPSPLIVGQPHYYIEHGMDMYETFASFLFFLSHNRCSESGSFFEIGPRNYLKLEHFQARTLNLGTSSPDSKQILSNWHSLMEEEGENVIKNPCLSLKGNVAFVTGADTPMGVLVATKLASMGAFVIAYQGEELMRAVPVFGKKETPVGFKRIRRSSVRMFQKIFGRNSISFSPPDETLPEISEEIPSRNLEGIRHIRGIGPAQAFSMAVTEYEKVDIVVHCGSNTSSSRLLDLNNNYFELLYKHHISTAYIINTELAAYKKGTIIHIGPIGNPGSSAIELSLYGLTRAISNLNGCFRVNTISVNSTATEDLNLTAELACISACHDSPFKTALLTVSNGKISQSELKHTMGFKVPNDDGGPEGIMKKWWQISKPKTEEKQDRRASTLFSKPVPALQTQSYLQRRRASLST